MTMAIIVVAIAATSSASAQSADSALLYACTNGEANRAGSLLESGADPNAVDDDGWTPLMLAAMNGNREIVDMLLQHGADPNIGESEYGSPLAAAAVSPVAEEDVSSAVIDALLRSGAEIDKTNGSGMTPLFFAAREGKLDVVRSLLKAGADPKHRDVRDWTPLMFGIMSEQTDLIQALLNAGADPNVREWETGRTSMHHAVERGIPEIIALLLENGADPDAGYNGVYPPSPLLLAISESKLEIADLLVRGGANPNYSDGGNYSDDEIPRTALDWARYQSAEKLEELIRNAGGLSQEELDSAYSSMLEATGNNDAATLRTYMNRGIDPRVEIVGEEATQRLLVTAAYYGSQECMQALLEYEKPFSEWDIATAYTMVVDDDHDEMAEYLLERYGGQIAASAINNSDVELLETVVAASSDVLKYRTAEEKTLLHSAVELGDSYAVDVLLSNGADPEATDRWGETPLFTAIRNDDGELIEMLVEASPDAERAVSLPNVNGLTPVHAAALAGQDQPIPTLVEYGADVNASDVNGWTPLHWAADRGYEAVVRTLIDLRADIMLRTDSGKTAADLARSANETAVLNLLEEAAGQ